MLIKWRNTSCGIRCKRWHLYPYPWWSHQSTRGTFQPLHTLHKDHPVKTQIHGDVGTLYAWMNCFQRWDTDLSLQCPLHSRCHITRAQPMPKLTTPAKVWLPPTSTVRGPPLSPCLMIMLEQEWYWLIAQPDDLSNIDIWISMSIPRWLEKNSSAMC